MEQYCSMVQAYLQISIALQLPVRLQYALLQILVVTWQASIYLYNVRKYRVIWFKT